MKTANTSSRAPKRPIEAAAENAAPRARVRRHAYAPVQTRRAFEAVADQIRGQLTSGALQPGDRLPPERELAEQFSLSRNTVREALRSLEMAGVLEFRKGATGGAFVREGQGDAVIAGFSDLFRLGAIRPADLTEARLIVSVAATRSCLPARHRGRTSKPCAKISVKAKLAVAEGRRSRNACGSTSISIGCSRAPRATRCWSS